MIRCAAVVIMCYLVLYTKNVHANDFCRFVFQVYEAAQSNFTNIRGRRDDSSENSWHSTLVLPGADRCYIQDEEFHCYWLPSDRRTIPDAVSNFGRGIESCLRQRRLRFERYTSGDETVGRYDIAVGGRPPITFEIFGRVQHANIRMSVYSE